MHYRYCSNIPVCGINHIFPLLFGFARKSFEYMSIEDKEMLQEINCVCKLETVWLRDATNFEHIYTHSCSYNKRNVSVRNCYRLLWIEIVFYWIKIQLPSSLMCIVHGPFRMYIIAICAFIVNKYHITMCNIFFILGPLHAFIVTICQSMTVIWYMIIWIFSTRNKIF